jgi:hypothetical protein
MHLIGFVVAGQHMHDQVDAEAIGDLALALSGKAAADRQHRHARVIGAQAAAQSLPPMITGVTPSFRLRNGIPSSSAASGGAASTQIGPCG